MENKIFSRQTWFRATKSPLGERVVGEGDKRPAPGTKGGEKLRPDRHYEHKQHAFDSLLQKGIEMRSVQRLPRDQPPPEA